MKARVFVTLKPGVLDPQGKAIHHALEGLGFGGVAGRPRRQADRARPRRRHQRRGYRGDVPQAARQHRDREFPDREAGSRHEERGPRLPRLQLRPRPRRRHRGRSPAARRRWSGTATASCPTAPTSSPFPAAFPTAIISARARWRRARRSCSAVAEAAGTRRAGARRLQRLPGADRSRPAARRADAQRRAALRLPPGRPQGREQPVDLHQRLSGRARRSASRSPTTTAITRPIPKRSTGSKAKAASPSATPERSTARRAASPGSSTPPGNVLGMMPHPERALEPAHGNTDGRRLFEGLLEAVA